jgi:hypothetical protein
MIYEWVIFTVIVVDILAQQSATKIVFHQSGCVHMPRTAFFLFEFWFLRIVVFLDIWYIPEIKVSIFFSLYVIPLYLLPFWLFQDLEFSEIKYPCTWKISRELTLMQQLSYLFSILYILYLHFWFIMQFILSFWSFHF